MAFRHIRAAQKQTVGDNIAKQILVEIASYIGNDDQPAYPSYRTLAESTEVHYNTVSAKVTYLEENGFLIVTKDGRKNKYTLSFNCDNDDNGLSHTDYDNNSVNEGRLSHPDCDNVTIDNELSQRIITSLSQLESRLSQIERQLSQNNARLSQPECDVSNRSNRSNKEKREEAQAPDSPPHLINENLNNLLVSNGLGLSEREDVLVFVEIFNEKCHPASNYQTRVENAILAKKSGMTHEEAIGICNGFWEKSGFGIGLRPHPSQVVNSRDTYRQWVKDGSPDNRKKPKRQTGQKPVPRPATNPQYKRPVGAHT